jgi:hypothetical protein
MRRNTLAGNDLLSVLLEKMAYLATIAKRDTKIQNLEEDMHANLLLLPTNSSILGSWRWRETRSRKPKYSVLPYYYSKRKWKKM